MKYIFILNSFSLKKKLIGLDDVIKKVCKKRKLDYVIEINSKDRSSEQILKKYHKGKHIIVAVGGDGTINRILNQIVGTKNILSYIPLGTGNDFYRGNKELLKEGINKVDLVKINNNYFLNISCFGIDADIGIHNDIIHSNLIPQSQRYNVSVLYHFFKYKPRKFKIEINNQVIENEFTLLALCNNRYYGGGYKIGFNSLVDDGLLDVYLVPKINKINTIKLLLGIKKGQHEKSDKVKIYHTDKVKIISPVEIDASIDGEILHSDKFNINLIHNGIEVYYNQGLIDDIIKYKEEKK